ncbi:MAG: ATPase [Rhodospirillaceae bacterium]|nr:ATPase [Rhodospirillaceae bacterium]|tara:strand:+ start:404 stop:1102 length:699 start_codon:yes stop_codon:yes gene_type:complete
MRRFYSEVEVSSDPQGFLVELDARPVMSPGKNHLILPSRGLADAVAAEWRVQGEKIKPYTMPLMSLASTAIDRVKPCPMRTITSIAAYAQTDLLCYRASEPEQLVVLQNKAWQPLLDWCGVVIGKPFAVTAGVMPIEQTAALEASLTKLVTKYDLFSLMGLYQLTNISGSVVIGLAIVEGHIKAIEGIKAAQIDDLYQIEAWGKDTEATARISRERKEMQEVAEFLRLARGE